VPGNYDGAAHIKDMASDGIDAAVVYPQMVYRAYTGLKDRELGLACLRAFNDWLLDDFCAADPARLIGMCMVPWEVGFLWEQIICFFRPSPCSSNASRLLYPL